jgi:hypothetical protein
MAFFTRRRDRDPDAVDESARRTEHVWRPWMPVAVLLGAASMALGIWALTRTGLNTDHMFRPHTRVLSFDHTPALALGEAVFGFVMILAVIMGLFGRTLMGMLGAAMLGFGVIVVADAWPGRIAHWTDARERQGWVFIAAGAVAFVAATMLPTIRHRSLERSREVRHVETREPATREVETREPVDRTETVEPADTRPRRHWWQPRREQTA